MAEPFSSPFPVPQEQIIASYTFSEIASGTGTVLFYGFSTREESTESFHLSQNSDFYSSLIEYFDSYSQATSFTKTLDVDFDLTQFNTHSQLEGMAYINLCGGIEIGTGAATDKDYYFIAKFRKWDGTTETEIADTQSRTYTYSSTDHEAQIISLAISIPRTSFSPGEQLRVTIEGYSKVTGGTDEHRTLIGLDPQNRDGTYITPSTDDPATTTQLKVYVPFRRQG